MIPAESRCVRCGLLFLTVSLLSACSGDGPTQPDGPEATLRTVSGDGQFGPSAQFLQDPLRVVVRRVADGQPLDGALVEWNILEGIGAQLEKSTNESDSTGLASVRFRLGGQLGRYLIRARLRDDTGEAVEFEAWAVLPPELTGLSTDNVSAGDVITLAGTNFSPIATHNVVLFSGIRGAVTAAQQTSLSVEVPRCLPTRAVNVSVRLGSEVSAALPLDVVETGEALELEFGADTTLTIVDGLSCIRLGSATGLGNYLAVVQSTSTVGAARFDYTFTGLRTDAAAPRVAHGSRRITAPESAPQGLPGRAQADWDAHLRGIERRLLPGGSAPSTPPAVSAARMPDVGDRRDFDVLTRDGAFDRITAEVRFVSEQAVLYEDIEASGSLSEEDVERFGSVFDDPIFPIDVGVFGDPSDIDGNGQIIMLFTPGVNRLSPAGSDGFVAGFFFGLDLMPELNQSNAAEIFYVMVPDPAGTFGAARTLDVVRNTVPSILAHELQHMIHYNQRILLRGAERSDAAWLSEGLAQMAEELVGDELRRRGARLAADQYQKGNWQRAGRFLETPFDVSLIWSAGQGTLAERGAGWLFVRYLKSQAASDDVLSELTKTARTGVENVEAVTGRPWDALFSDWSAAIAVEEQLATRAGLPVRAELHYPDIDLVEAISRGVGDFPLQRYLRSLENFSDEGRVRSASGAYYLLVTDSKGLAVSLAGPDGGPVSAEAGLRLKLVRLF